MDNSTDFKFIVHVHIQSLFCPEVEFNKDGSPVSVCLSMMGHTFQSKRVPPGSPLFFDDHFKFETNYYIPPKVGNIRQFLDNHLASIEIVQWLSNEDTENCVVVADLNMPMSRLLYPESCNNYPYRQGDDVPAVLYLKSCNGIETDKPPNITLDLVTKSYLMTIKES